METEHLIETNRSVASTNVVLFRSVGGRLAKQLGLSDFSSSEMVLSKIHPESTKSHCQGKKEFLPFLNERDQMNRLLTVEKKYDPNKLEESLNPSFYYKSERFNKQRLLLVQANRTKFALGKLLQFQIENDEKSNIKEALHHVGKKKVRVKKISAGQTPKFTNWLKLDGATEENQSIEIYEEKKTNRMETFEPETQNITAINGTNSISASLLTNIKGVKSHKKQNTITKVNGIFPPSLTESPKSMKKHQSLTNLRNKKLFTPRDDFCNFYQKLNSDIRQIPSSCRSVRKKAKDNVNNLINIFKKFEETKDLPKLDDLRIMSPKDKKSHRTPRLMWVSQIQSPKAELNNKSERPRPIFKPLAEKQVYQQVFKKKNLSVGALALKSFKY